MGCGLGAMHDAPLQCMALCMVLRKEQHHCVLSLHDRSELAWYFGTMQRRNDACCGTCICHLPCDILSRGQDLVVLGLCLVLHSC